MTDGFNSCQNVVCNFTEGDRNISKMCLFLSIEGKKNLL